MKMIFEGFMPQLILSFLAAQLNFNGFTQGKTIAINQTMVFTSASPSGGVLTTVNGYNIHTFKIGGTLSVPNGYTADGVEVLIVAGGGGGGYRHAGGGGAGGLIDNTSYTLTTTQSVVVGNGGIGATDTNDPDHNVNGGQSSFGGSIAIGGGAGGNNSSQGQNGGSGGGGSNGSYGGLGTAQQGQKGGNQYNGQGCCHAWGAGGGGYLVAGADPNGDFGSNGGAGASFNISGSSVNYADGGGGGNGIDTTIFTGGNGSGGSGGNPSNLAGLDGTANTGSGGGGGGANSNTSGLGGSGGSGIVIIKYAATSTGTWSSDNAAIATVDVNGVVTGISAGTTAINYIVLNGSSSSKYIQQVTVTGLLPVTMLYFIAAQKDCITQLSWKTTTEINNSYYAVEHSRDGIVFTQAAKVKSINMATGSTYAYTFTSLTDGTNYYRLKIVDIDNKYTYSKTIAVTTSFNCGKGIQLRISPNPSKSLIVVSGMEKGSCLSLLNSSGKQLIKIIAKASTQCINISAYPIDVYFLRNVAPTGNTQTVKLVKE